MNHDAIEMFRSSRRSQKYSSSIFPRPAAHPSHFTENFRSVGMIYSINRLVRYRIRREIG